MKHLFLILFLCVQFISFAQPADKLTPNSDSLRNINYLYLYTGNIVTGKYVSYEDRVFKKNHFLVDDKRFELGEVKFYQNERGFFGNVSGLGFQSGYAERTQSGDINLFELEVRTTTPMMGANGMMTGGMMNTSIIDYYNKGFGSLKRANYENLKTDLTDKPEAKLYLDKYNKIRMTQNGFYVAGGALLAGALVAFYNESQSNPQNFNPSNALVFGVLGGGTLLTAYVIGLNKKDKLQEAIAAYNRF